MAELRSFLIGVVVAGVLLGVIAMALGAFGGDDSEPIAARLLGTPVPTFTPQATSIPGATVLPTLAPTTQPSPQPTATEAASVEPTAEPTSTPEPQPTADPVDIYIATIQPIVADLDANINYVIGQGSANPSGSTQASNTIKDLAARMLSASPPACLAAAHDILAQASNQAAAAADQLIAAFNAANESLIQAALSAMNTAHNTLGSGTAAVSSAPC